MQLDVIDRQGRKTMNYDEAVKYHGGSHVAGVALGWKFLEGALDLCGVAAPDRNDIRLTLNAAPCGVVDCLEYATRAFSRRRAVVDPGISSCLDGSCGNLTLVMDCGRARVSGKIADGILPRDFVDRAKNIEGGLCSPEEISDWQKLSRELAVRVMEMEPGEVFDLTVADKNLESKNDENTDSYEVFPEASSLLVNDESGPCEISLDEMIRFHDKDHFAGVVLAHKILSLAFNKLWKGEVPERGEIHIQSGLNPPGLVDSFEYVARAVTRQRFAFTDTECTAPDSPFGKFAFRIGNGKESLKLRVREGLLPDDFASVGRKAEAGVADADEQARWESYKHGIGRALLEMDAEDILEPVC